MGTLDTEAAAIKALIETITDIGVVYDYTPVPVGNDWTTFVQKFTATIGGVTQVRAWTIAVISEDRAYRTVAIGATKLIRKPLWLIRGYLSWQDPDSDKTFRGLVESVETTLDTNRSLSSTVIDHEATTVQYPNNGQGVILGDVLCHYAELRLSPWTEETLATV